MYEGDAQNCIPFLAAETLKTVYSFHPSHSTQLNETLRENHFFASLLQSVESSQRRLIMNG